MFIIFGMIFFLIFTKKLYAFLVLFLYISIFYKNKPKLESLILLLLCLILSLSHSHRPKGDSYTGKVDKLHDYGFTLRGFAYKVYVSSDFKPGLGDKVTVSGEIIHETKPSFNRHIGMVEEAQILKHKETKNIRKYIYKKNPKNYALLFDPASDHMINSLSLQMMGIYAIYCLLYQRFLGDLKYDRLFLLFLSSLFGRSFMWWRLFLKSSKVSTNHQIIFLLILFPQALTSPSFIYAFSLYLLTRFTDELKNLDSSLLFAQLSLFFFNEWHVLMIFIYPFLRYLSGIYAILILAACFISPLNYILLVLQGMGSFTIQSSFYQRFLVRGSLNFLSFFMLLFVREKKGHYLVFMIMLILVVYPPFARITYIDVGQGDSTLVSLPFNTSHYLVDTGRAYAYKDVKRVLKQHGVKNLNYLVLTHDDADHVENKDILIQDFNPRHVMEEKNQPIEFMHSHLQGVEFGDDNEDSIILSFDLHGIRYLLLGDAHKKQEEFLVKNNPNLKVDILKLGHHGSDTSTSDQLLKVSQAKIAIISSKSSVYNHPRPEVMRRLFNHNILPIQTSTDGNITLVSSTLFQYIKTSEGSFAIIDKGD